MPVMRCLHCAYENAEPTGACNLCGKLLQAKRAPAATAPVAAPASAPATAAREDPAPAARAPSWPNRAILCFLFTPVVTLILVPFMLHREAYQDDLAAQDQSTRLLCMTLLSAGYLAATVPLAARLAVAPLFATVLSAVALLLGMPLHFGLGSPLSWVILAGLGMAWSGRDAFTRPFVPARLPGWALDGYKRLLAPDRWAALRVIGGGLLFLGGVAFILIAGTALRSYIPISKPVAKFLAIPAFLGGFLAASGLSWSEREPQKP